MNVYVYVYMYVYVLFVLFACFVCLCLFPFVVLSVCRLLLLFLRYLPQTAVQMSELQKRKAREAQRRIAER